MNSPKVSVIIPCFNMEKYLSECMTSVLHQTLDNIEVICIDDGSTDATPELLDEFQRQDPRVYVIHQANQGVAAARNTGIREAEGEFVAFMDPDDFYPDNGTLELLYNKAVQNNVYICGGSFSNYNQQNGKVTTCYIGDYAKYSFPKEGRIDYRDYQFDFGYHRFLYNRVFLLENNLFFPPYARFQDPPFFVRAMITAKSFYAVPDVVYRYRVGIQDKPTSWPKEKLHDMMQGHLDVLMLSSEAQLCQLHALTVRRFEANDVYEPVMKSLQEKDKITEALLLKINASIDISLLKESGAMARKENSYTIRELRKSQEEAGSVLYRFMDRFRKLFQSCRYHGIRYTLRLIAEKFGA